jgi:ubiquinone/menaquinone biosynthesis C-methylase UbiE
MTAAGKIKAAEYFDSIAAKWDSWEDMVRLKERLAEGLVRFGIRPDELILDAGCGTGNLTAALLEKLSIDGRITAVDYSIRMIEVAQNKIKDPRVKWICDSLENMDEGTGVFDRVICYSVWPHIRNHETAAGLLSRMLKQGGMLHVWHIKSREAINRIHTEASDVLKDHLLVPARQTAALLERFGFVTEEMQDDDSGYLVTARKIRA